VFAALGLASALTFTSATERRVDNIVEAEILAHHAPGIAVAIAESGRIVYARGFGHASVSQRLAVTPETQFDIGQVSRQFTAAAVLLLEQSGKLSLDDPVTKYLPDLTIAHSVTIRELLEQTSGLPHVTNWAHLLAATAAGHAVAAPGTAYDPNPLNYLLAGLIVEHVSGVPLSDFVQQQIFVPLVMDRSLYIGDIGVSDHAVGYDPGPHGFNVTPTWSATRTAGDSGVISNVYDLAKWDIEFPILLRVDAVREMFTPGVAGTLDQHGMGWTLDQRVGHRFLWQDGEIPGYQSMNAVLPDDHVAVVVLTNVSSAGISTALPERVAGEILDALMRPSAQHVDNSVISRAREWLNRLAEGHIDRTQLTADFSTYLTDDVVRNARIASYGKVVSMIPIASVPAANGATEYEFLVHFARESLHYRLTLSSDGKIAFISFTP
jgi:D-alanyl-D-alanine carboxypeptidase